MSFYSHHIERMIEDYHKIRDCNEELKNYVYDYIQEIINNSLNNLTPSELVNLLDKLNQNIAL
jgi:hypothetical protein